VTSLGERHSYFLPAVLLVYQSVHSADVQVGFAMNGRISPEHEAAFAHARLRKRFVLGGEGGPSAEEVAAQLLGKDLVEKADRSDVLRLQGVIANALPVSEGQEVDPALAAEAAVAEEQLRALAVRPLETYEHPTYLRDALASSKRRLLIISPWLRRAVVDRQFVADLERLLSQNVDVYIGWGISKTEMDRDADASVRADLDRLAARHQNFHFLWLGDTHAKVLLCDDRFVIVGSFNWLSFQGDPSKTFRDERGMFVSIPNVIEEQFKVLAARFSAPATVAAPVQAPPGRRVFSP
jgi:phosphatidylserine/phosphatidylglycerophosphate/cardiolipin synthase-like enzyme